MKNFESSEFQMLSTNVLQTDLKTCISVCSSFKLAIFLRSETIFTQQQREQKDWQSVPTVF